MRIRPFELNVALCLVALALWVPVGADATTTLSVQAAAQGGPPRVRSVQRASADEERFVAAAKETVEILFQDGTSVTLSPGASVDVRRYRYDRSTRMGELQMSVLEGTIRLSGGILNNTHPILVALPGGEAELDNGAAFFSVSNQQTEVTFIAGRALALRAGPDARVALTAAGATQTLLAGHLEGSPHKADRAQLQRLAQVVNPGLVDGIVPTFIVDRGTPAISTAAEIQPAEVDAAKDDKQFPAPPVNLPGAVCASGTCSAGLGTTFALATPIGSIGNNQSGLTIGADNWAVFSQQGAAPKPIDAGTAAIYSAVGTGFRNSTAEIVTSSASTPLSLAFVPGKDTQQATSIDAVACTACAPIVSLLPDASGTQGPNFVFAGAQVTDGFSANQLLISFGVPQNWCQTTPCVNPNPPMAVVGTNTNAGKGDRVYEDLLGLNSSNTTALFATRGITRVWRPIPSTWTPGTEC